MADAREYTVEIEGFILGDWKDKGAPVRLTPKQARQFLFEGRIKEPAKSSGKAKASA